MDTYQYLTMDVADGVATITLNRADAGNAINTEFSYELNHASNYCQAEDDIRAVIITANGNLFCAGGDLGTMATAGGKVNMALKELAEQVHAAYATFMRMPAPVIVAVNGAAAGIGLSLTLVGDLTIASEKASFTMAYTAAGLSPDGGATYLLPKTIGIKRAKEMMLTNRKVTAEEALEWGLVNQVVEPEALLETAQSLAKQLAKGATNAFGTVKNLMLSGFSESLESQMALEVQGISNNAMSVDGQEGIKAFLEKRRPTFKG